MSLDLTDENEAEEELEDLPDTEKFSDPLMNCPIRRKLFDAVYTGRVEDIEVGSVSRERLYRVRYCDDDIEHFTASMVEEYRDHDAHAAQLVSSGLKKPAAATKPGAAMMQGSPSSSAAKRTADRELDAPGAAKRPAAASAARGSDSAKEAEMEVVLVHEDGESESPMPALKKPAAAAASSASGAPGIAKADASAAPEAEIEQQATAKAKAKAKAKAGTNGRPSATPTKGNPVLKKPASSFRS